MPADRAGEWTIAIDGTPDSGANWDLKGDGGLRGTSSNADERDEVTLTAGQVYRFRVYPFTTAARSGLTAMTLTLTVLTDNTPPVADAGMDQTVDAGAPVTLDGTGSSDADNDPLTYAWTVTSTGTTVTLTDADMASPTFTAPDVSAIETLEFSLTVNDGTVDSEPSTVSVTVEPVEPPNSAPVAVAGPPQTVDEDALVTLNGTGSSDADDDPLTYAWSLTSTGTTVTLTDADTASPTFTAPNLLAQEDLEFALTVNDGTVDSAPATVTVTIDADNDPPIADAGEDQTVRVGQRATLDGTDSSDPEGQALTYAWTLTSTGTTVTLTDADTATPAFTAPSTPTTLVFTLSVRDAPGNTAVSDTVTVTVEPEIIEPPELGTVDDPHLLPDPVAVSAQDIFGQLRGTGRRDNPASATYFRFTVPADRAGEWTIAIDGTPNSGLDWDLRGDGGMRGLSGNADESDEVTLTAGQVYNFRVYPYSSNARSRLTAMTLTLTAPPSTGPVFAVDTLDAVTWIDDVAITGFTVPEAVGGSAPLNYTASGLPAGVSMSSARLVSGTPTATGPGTATVTVRDADGDTDTLTFPWTVEADTSPMFAVDTLPGRTWAEDAATTAFTVPAATGGNVPLTYSLSGEPADIVIDPDTREVSGTPTAPGSGTATVTVRDNDGDADTLTFTWTVVTPPPVPGRPTGPDTDSDGAYAIAWSTSTGAMRYELQESLDGGTWSSVSTTGTSTTKSFIGKASGEYLYRVRACNASVCSDWSPLKILFVNLPPTVGFDSTYVVRTGDLGSDGDTDIYLSPLATGTGNVGEFILENDSGTFSLDTSPTLTELAAAQSWTVSTQLAIMLEDVNVDGVWDAFVTGIAASSAFGDAVDQIVVSPRTAGGAPTGLVAVDADLIDFFESVMAWYEDFGHFDRRVSVGSLVLDGFTTGVFGPDILDRCVALWGQCEVRANIQLAQHFGGAANCVAELAYRGIVPRDELGNVISRWVVCDSLVFAIFGVAQSEVTIKDFSSVPAGAVENVARFMAIAETGEPAYEVEDLADVLEVLVLGGVTIVGDQIEERAEEVHQALLNIWAILARRIFPGERVDPESDVVRESDTVYVTRRRVRLVVPIGFTDADWHLALEYTYPGAAASFLSNLTIAAYNDDGRLVARRNDPSERNNILTGTVSSTRFLHNLQLWLALGAADRNYRNCPPFVVYDLPYPDQEGEYNSNGYINALVSFVNGTVASVTDEPFQFANYTHGDDPVPRAEFLECQFPDIE